MSLFHKEVPLAPKTPMIFPGSTQWLALCTLSFITAYIKITKHIKNILLQLADLKGSLEAVSCHALIKTIYRSKCTCIKVATSLLWHRLFCFIVVFYLDIKLLKLSLTRVILRQYMLSIHWISEPVFSFCAFLLYIATPTGRMPLELARSAAALVSQDKGERVKCRVSGLILWLIFSRKSPDETHKSLIKIHLFG